MVVGVDTFQRKSNMLVFMGFHVIWCDGRHHSSMLTIWLKQLKPVQILLKLWEEIDCLTAIRRVMISPAMDVAGLA